MTPPPAEELIPRLFLGPALRAQPDRRLVHLVRDGHETAFDEIMRRYGVPLRRYAGAIVGGRAEDVVQDSFSKALQALRRNESEIELRPWLYRIVRNTALNDLRDRHPTEVLVEGVAGRQGVAEEVERREEMGELIERLRALPETQRAAIVMRELEGLGHDEIAASLGVSDGAARQAIHRARTTLRNGVGMAIPLPLLRAMLESAPTAELAAGGAGAGLALKAVTVTVLVAGTFGAGVALHEGSRAVRSSSDAGGATPSPSPRRQLRLESTPSSAAARATKPDDSTVGHRNSGEGGGGRGASHGQRSGRSGSDDNLPSPGSDSPSEGASPNHSGPGPSGGDNPGSIGGSPASGPGPSGDGSGGGGSSGPGSGSGDLSTGSGEGSGSSSGPGSDGSGSGGGDNSGPGSESSRDSGDGGGFSQQMEPQPEEDR